MSKLKEKSIAYYIMDEYGNKTHAVSKNAVSRSRMNLNAFGNNSIKAHKLPLETYRYGRMPKEVVESLKAGKK